MVVPTELSPAKSGFWANLKSIITGREEPRLLRPYGVYADDGVLYVTDPGGGRVHVMNMEQRSHRFVGGDEAQPFGSPIGITGDGNHQVYFTDSLNGKVYRFLEGDDEAIPFNLAPLIRPTGIAFHAARGLFYVAATGEHAVVALDRQGIEQFRFGKRGSAPGEFNYPTDLFVDHEGRVWVTDSMNFRIQAFTADGNFILEFGEAGDTSGRHAKPKGVALDSDGHVYVCDALFDAVQIFDEQGQLLLWFGEKGDEAGQFWMPSGIYIDKDNRIYVTDTYNRRIQVFRYLPEVTTGGDVPMEDSGQ